MKIEESEIKIFFELAVKLHNKEISFSDAKNQLADFGINPNNANYYLYIYPCLLKGQLFKGTINARAMRFYLDKIFEIKGTDYLQNALLALSLHIDYYESASGSSVIENRKILNEYLVKSNIKSDDYFNEEIDNNEILKEGLIKQIKVNIYERNPIARSKCIDYHKAICKVCACDFEVKYGILGKGFIHIHHVVDISTMCDEYEVDYINDLKPVCPNCHAMLHKRKPAYKIEELKVIMNKLL